MPLATFNGTTLNVEIPSTGGPTITMAALADFYEPWKDFLRQGAIAGQMENKKFPQCFRPIAGDPITTSVKYQGMIFMRNDLGWRLRLPDENVTLIITGLFALESTILAFHRERSGKTGSILGLADFVVGVEGVDTLRKLQQNRMETNPVTGVMTVYDDDDVTVLLSGNIYEDVLASQLYRGRGIERRNRLT